MQKLILGIGIPASGKTTALKAFAEKNDYVYLNQDDIRTKMAINAADQSKNKEVWDEAMKIMFNSFADGKTVVFDGTFTKPEQRSDFIRVVRNRGLDKIVGVFVDTPLEVAKERNINRDRVVPEHAIERMHEFVKYFKPGTKDGFDSLFTLNENQELIKAEVKYEDETISKEFKLK